MSQERLADGSGVPRAIIANIETGRRSDVGLAQAELICQALGVDFAEMVHPEPLTITLNAEVIS
jgi:transcriptional regulator with XRE-family HTH domain